MATMTQAAIAASVVLGLLSVPAASQTVEISEPVSDDLATISGAENIPESYSRTTSPDGFKATIQTAFDEFSTSVSSDSVDASVESPGSRLDVTRSPDSTEWVLTTPKGTLTVTESSDSTTRKVSTPHGDLTVKVEDGAREVEFSGSSRDKVEKSRHDLEKLLDERRKDLEKKRQELRQRSAPDVEVSVNESTASSPEYAVIKNNEFEPVSLEGWSISDEASTHEFEPVTVGARGKLYVYSAEKSEIDGEESPAVFDTGISWNDNGDTATLFTEKGLEVDEESY